MSRESRSRIMRGVRSKHTLPEMRVRQALHAAGLRYKLHVKDLPGTPDLVFPKYHAIVEVHGCFWHSHKCLRGRVPQTNTDFWLEKLARNKLRDSQKMNDLSALGYRVKVVWECELQDSRFDQTIAELLDWIKESR